MQTATPTPVLSGTNPYIIDLAQMGKWAFFTLLAIILFALLLNILGLLFHNIFQLVPVFIQLQDAFDPA